jgi:hypothetical protein
MLQPVGNSHSKYEQVAESGNISNLYDIQGTVHCAGLTGTAEKCSCYSPLAILIVNMSKLQKVVTFLTCLTFRGLCIVIYILIIKPERCSNLSNLFWE